MSRARMFDWDEAGRLYATGAFTYEALAQRFDVSPAAIYRAVNPAARAREHRRKSLVQRSGVCAVCGTRCSYNPYTGRRSGRCRACASEAATTTVRPTTLKCRTCDAWKPDEEFPHNKHRRCIRRRGRHQSCRSCLTVLRRAYREARRVPCSHGCGAMVLHERRDKTKPPECAKCAHARLQREGRIGRRRKVAA